MPEDRRLAAIMFTDIVGYTELMGRDEDQAFQLLRKNRDIQRPLIKKYRGEWLKEMGDGILASFNSASDGVRCASEIQTACKKESVALRIGIHEGEVVFEGGDVLGDGVNVASRLEAFAEEGTINISGAVYKDIKNKAGIVAEFIEEKTLKGVDDPVKVYRILGEGEESQTKKGEPKKVDKKYLVYLMAGVLLVISALLVWKYLIPKTNAAKEKTIAVLPFINQSENDEYAYFGDALTDEIIMQLLKVHDFEVRSNTSVMKYKGTDKSISEIGNELNVNYVIEGTAQRYQNNLRVRVQLRYAETDENIWGRIFEREWSDIFKLQGDIAKQVAAELEIVLSPKEIQEIEMNPTDNLDAYEQYLKGKEYIKKYNLSDFSSNSDLKTASLLFQQAIALDPQFALAYIEFGVSYFRLNANTNYLKETFADTLKYLADKALSIKADLAEGYWLRGVYFEQIGDYDKSIIQLKKAIELNPNHGNSYFRLGINYTLKGQPINALINHKKAKKLLIGDPEYPNILVSIGDVYHGICDYEQAEIEMKELVNYNPGHGYYRLRWLALSKGEWDKFNFYTDKICAIDSGFSCSFGLYILSNHTGDFTQALKYAEKSRIEANEARYSLFRRQYEYGYILYNLGRKEEAQDYFNKQIEFCKESIRLKRTYAVLGGSYYKLGGTYAFLGEKEKAYQILHEMEQECVIWGNFLWYMQVDPLYESLWDDDEFKQIIQRQEKKFADIRTELDKLRAEGVL